MTKNVSDVPQLGSFALVTYIPNPLGTHLSSLRQSLTGSESPEAHITVLPPRPLVAAVETVSAEAKRVLEGFAPFRARLSAVQVFRETSLLYLEIANGNRNFHELHDALNTGLLEHEENFQFEPHLTLSGRVEGDELIRGQAKAQKAWETLKQQAEFEVSEVVALWQPPHASSGDWTRVWSFKLGQKNSSVARA